MVTGWADPLCLDAQFPARAVVNNTMVMLGPIGEPWDPRLVQLTYSRCRSLCQSGPIPTHQPCVHDKETPQSFGVPPGIPALYVAQPCSYASKQERAESFFSLPLSALGCHVCMFASAAPQFWGQ